MVIVIDRSAISINSLSESLFFLIIGIALFKNLELSLISRMLFFFGICITPIFAQLNSRIVIKNNIKYFFISFLLFLISYDNNFINQMEKCPCKIQI
jgi:hypothetical protein